MRARGNRWRSALDACAPPALALGLLFSVAAAPAAPTDASVLGLCPPDTRRVDAFVQLLCEGEAALANGVHTEALAKFSAAAETPRLAATNELAWAGLAAGYCDAKEIERARLWSTRFQEARRIWLGEVDCAASGAAPQPFVRRQLCLESMTPDYSFVKSNPDAAISGEIRSRFDAISRALAHRCGKAVGSRQTAIAPAARTDAAHAAPNTVKTSQRKVMAKTGKNTARQVSGKKVSPSQEK